jgi:hypothetical protein
MTLTFDEARKIAAAYVSSQEEGVGRELVLLDAETIERAFGWVFFYDSRMHFETGEFRYSLAGNAPIVVTRADGVLHETGTGRPLAEYLKRFE